MNIPFIQLQRADRERFKGLYIDVTQIESFTPGESAETTIIGMRSGETWEVHDGVAELMDMCFNLMRSISKETSNAGN